MADRELLAEIIRQLYLKGMTRKELSGEIGVNPTHLSKVLTGYRKSASTMKKIVAYFGFEEMRKDVERG